MFDLQAPGQRTGLRRIPYLWTCYSNVAQFLHSHVEVASLLRRALYPPYRFIIHHAVQRRYGQLCPFHVDEWLWGQRGNDYEHRRRQVNRLLPLHGTHILIAGCGTGRDVESWLPFRPARILAVDLFQYEEEWTRLRTEFGRRFPLTEVQFLQGNLTHLPMIPSHSVDVLASDAVFEHLNDPPSAVQEFYRVLRPGGLLYATFGPLWHCWQGDHISGYDRLEGGYNHLLLSQAEYATYVDGLGPYKQSEEDGRTWLRHGLFSYLRSDEYLSLLSDAGFDRLHVSLVLQPNGALFLRQRPDVGTRLIRQHGEVELLVWAMTVIFRKPESP